MERDIFESCAVILVTDSASESIGPRMLESGLRTVFRVDLHRVSKTLNSAYIKRAGNGYSERFSVTASGIEHVNMHLTDLETHLEQYLPDRKTLWMKLIFKWRVGNAIE